MASQTIAAVMPVPESPKSSEIFRCFTGQVFFESAVTVNVYGIVMVLSSLLYWTSPAFFVTLAFVCGVKVEVAVLCS